MAYDALTMRAVTQELNGILNGGRINRVYQPSRFDIILQIHAGGANHRLLLSAHPQLGGIYLTQSPASNPAAPPMFCMLLRKHLEGFRIDHIFQKDLERVLILVCTGIDETGLPATRWLIAEIMGKHSNLILTHPNGGSIIDSIRRIPHQVSRIREILPGIPYAWPPPQERKSPFTISSEEFQQGIMERPPQEKIWKAILASYEGLGPLSAREIVYRAGLDSDHRIEWLDSSDRERLYNIFSTFWETISTHQYQPVLAVSPQEKKALGYAPYPLYQFPADWGRTYSSMNLLLEEYFTQWAGVDRLEEARSSLRRSVVQHIERTRNRLAAIQESLVQAEKADELRAWGEVIIARVHLIRKGDHTVSGPDYRNDPHTDLIVPLDPQKTPAENAQTYFRRYSKAKKSLDILHQQLASTQYELVYLESIELNINNADSTVLLKEIRRELEEEGYLKEQRGKKRKASQSDKPSQPLELTDLQGYRILIGRNNRQNDLVTMRLARSEDLWFHAKDIPGSHVVIQLQGAQEYSDTIIHKAASLAAFFSQARNASKVPVDYTRKKHVRKPKGAKPGMVIYDHQKTVMATPEQPITHE